MGDFSQSSQEWGSCLEDPTCGQPRFMQTQHTHECVKGKWEDILPYSAETEMIGWFIRHHENTQNWRQKAFSSSLLCLKMLPEYYCGIHSCSTPRAILRHFNRPRRLQYHTKCENGSDNTNCDLKYLYCRHTRALAFLWQQQLCSGFLFASVFSGTKRTSIFGHCLSIPWLIWRKMTARIFGCLDNSRECPLVTHARSTIIDINSCT